MLCDDSPLAKPIVLPAVKARALIERVASLSEMMRGAAASPRGPLQIGSITASTMGVLPRILPSFRERFPLMRFSVETLAIDAQLRALIERRIDVGILRLPVVDERLASAPIAKESLDLALSHDHPLASRASIPLRAIDGATLITMRLERAGGFYEHIFALRAIEMLGLRPELEDVGNGDNPTVERIKSADAAAATAEAPK